MIPTEFDGMVRNEQYKDMIREAKDAARLTEGRPRSARSGAHTILLVPVLLVSLAARLISFAVHRGHPS